MQGMKDQRPRYNGRAMPANHANTKRTIKLLREVVDLLRYVKNFLISFNPLVSVFAIPMRGGSKIFMQEAWQGTLAIF